MAASVSRLAMARSRVIRCMFLFRFVSCRLYRPGVRASDLFGGEMNRPVRVMNVAGHHRELDGIPLDRALVTVRVFGIRLIGAALHDKSFRHKADPVSHNFSVQYGPAIPFAISQESSHAGHFTTVHFQLEYLVVGGSPIV